MLNVIGVLLLLLIFAVGGGLVVIGQPVIGLSITTASSLTMFIIERFIK